MLFDFAEALYYLIPLAALVFFGISLFRYCYAKHRNKRNPGTYFESELKIRKIWLIVSSVIVGLMAIVVGGFIGLLLMAVAYM